MFLCAPLLWWVIARPLQAALAATEAARATNETLLREVHHRVKNNLQMLCDMLYLQMEGLADEAKSAELRDICGRLYAIARLHDVCSHASVEFRLDSFCEAVLASQRKMPRGCVLSLARAIATAAMPLP